MWGAVHRSNAGKQGVPGVLKKLLPTWVREELVGLRETLVDGWRYQRATCSDDRLSTPTVRFRRHEARLTMEYHRVEKSLSLPAPRRPFGLTLRPRLVGLLAETREMSEELPYRTHATEALQALDRWNDGGTIDSTVSPHLESKARQLAPDVAASFFHSRHSVRDFDVSRPPTQAEIDEAVELARNTPSVCNRQGYRAHIFTNRDLIGQMLRLQGGATGFSESIPVLIVVTARRALFVGPLERNQRWVDGGLFAMTLVWALHAVGLATCMLNWAMAARTSDRLRTMAGIAADEDVVVLIAVGHAAEGARVARSPKRLPDDLAVLHSASSDPHHSDIPRGEG